MLGWSPDQLLDCTLKQFFSALKGKREYDSQQLEVQQQLLFKGLQYNSGNIAAGLSKELAEAIQKHKFSWEEDKKEESKQQEKFNYEGLLGFAKKLEDVNRKYDG